MRFPFYPKRNKEPPMPDKLRDFVLGNDDLNPTGSGVFVDEMSSLRVSAVYACVRIIAETVASLPLPLFRTLANGGREHAYQHPLYSLLHDMPNDEMSSFSFRESLMTSLLLWGNAYVQIVRSGDRITALQPLSPQRVSVERDFKSGQLSYIYSSNSGTRKFTDRDLMHIPALSFDGLVGLSPIAQSREAIALSLATEDFGARFFGNGARPGGVLEHPGVLKDPAKVRESWDAVYRGTRNAHRVAVLEEGMSYKPIGIPPEDAQFLETRKFQVNEICRIFRVPPHMVGDLERATNNNIEEQSIEFVVHTIRPWLVRWEQAIYRSLLTEGERKNYFARFNVDGLLRGDFKTRMEGYAIARQNGWLSANDIRALEELNPIPEDQGGDQYLVNGNMRSAANAAKTGGEANDDSDDGSGAAIAPADGTAGASQNGGNSAGD